MISTESIAEQGYFILAGISAVHDSADSIYFGAENALAAGLFPAVEQQEVEPWQPLILYGDTGSGKSFIALSIADRWSTSVDTQGIVTTAADLARLFQPSRLAAELDQESQKYSNASLLVIDDLDQLAGRSHVCSWLVGILDQRQSRDLPSIVTTKSMTTLSELPNRLFSRLAAGLPIPCALPAADTRREIIRHALQQGNKSTKRVTDTSLALVNSMVARSAGLSVTATRNVAIAHETGTDRQAQPANDTEDFPKQCLSAVARRFGVRVADIKSPSRRKNTVMARSIAMFLIREFTALSLVDIGQCFQNRDHTTVRHACQKIRKLLASDPQLQEAVRSVCVSLNRRFDMQWSVSLDDKCA